MTTTVDLDLRWLAPCITAEPIPLEQTVELGYSATVPFTITNWGAGSTAFGLSEQNDGFRITIPASDGDFPLGSAAFSSGPAPREAVPEYPADAPLGPMPMGDVTYAVDVYPGENLVTFDSDVPGAFTTVGSVAGTTYFAGDFVGGDFSTLYVINYDTNELRYLDTATGAMTTIGSATPTTGESWSGATGTSSGTLYAASAACGTRSTLYTIDLAAGTATEIGEITNGACIIDIAIDATGAMYGVDIVSDSLVQIDPATGAGTIIGSIGFDANYAQGMDFEEVSGVLYLAAYNNGTAQGELRIADTTTGNSALVGAFQGGAEVDAMAFATSTGGPGGDIPWLDESPTFGSVGGDSAAVIDVTFDAGDAITQVTQPGEYFGTLFVQSDDPIDANLAVPVTMTVTPPATWGKLTGTVAGLGYCDADAAPVAGTEVFVEASDGMTYTLVTDDAGMYAVWMDETASPVTITVDVPDHEKGDVTGVPLVGGNTTVVDFNLRWLVPCVGVAPDAVETTVELGATTTKPMTLTNTGAAAATWNLTELADWLAVDPIAGAMPADTGEAPVDVNFDASYVDQPGVYAAEVDLASDDPVMPLQTVPVTMTVTPPAGWALLDGTVSGLGYCDADSAPIEGASVTIEGGLVLTTTTTAILTEDFESGVFPPLGWGVENYGGDCVWYDDDALEDETGVSDFGEGNLTGGTGNFADADSDYCDMGSTMDTGLVMPAVDLSDSEYTSAELTFASDYYQMSSQAGYVDVSLDGGGNWTTLATFSADARGPSTETVDLSTYLGSASVTLRFRFVSPGWYWWWQVDDVEVSVQESALVADSVGLTTAADGYYSYWVEPGTYTVTATAPDHTVGQAVVAVPPDTPQTEDFDLRWLEPCVAVSPDSIDDTLPMGAASDHTLTIDNTGAGATAFSFEEFDEGYALPTVAIPAAPVGMRIASVGDFSVSGDPAAVPGAVSNPAPAESRPEGIYALTHSLSQVVTAGNSVSCNASGLHADNSYIRVFDLAGFGITGTFDVQQVEVGIETAAAGSDGLQPGVINLYTLSGPLAWANMTLIGSAAVDVADQSLTVVSVPVTGTAPAGSELVVEFFTPDGQNDGHSLYVGSNSAGQTAPTYLAADACGASEPTDVAAIGFPGMHVVMNVIGYTPEDVNLLWLSEDPELGVTAPDSTEQVTVTLDADRVPAPGIYRATLVATTDDPMAPRFPIAVAMTVTLPANYGLLTGTVYGTGYCDGEMNPLASANVVIEGEDGVTVTVTTNAAGVYEAWVERSVSPYTVTAMFPEHWDGVETGILVAGTDPIVQDVALRWMQPCVGTTPAELTAEVALGMSTTTYMTVANLGGYDLNWSLSEGEEGFVTMADGPFLVVSEDDEAAGAMEAALTTLGYTYADVESSGFTGMSMADLLTYEAVLYAGTVSNGSEDAQAVAYLDAGGRLLVSDNDYAYFYCEGGSIGATLGPDYLQCEYVSDSGSDGVITGIDIMSGITADVSDDPFPDDIVLHGPDAVGIFQAPSGNLAGLRIERNDYKAVLLTWDYNHIGAGTAGDPEELTILDSAIDWLTGGGDVPWLSEDPESGTTAIDARSTISVTFDAGVPEVTQPGTYTSTLTVESDDPMYPEITLPVDDDRPRAHHVGQPGGYRHRSGLLRCQPDGPSRAPWSTSRAARG